MLFMRTESVPMSSGNKSPASCVCESAEVFALRHCGVAFPEQNLNLKQIEKLRLATIRQKKKHNLVLFKL